MSKWRAVSGKDLVFAAGLAMLTAGIAAVDWRAALIVAGLVLMGLAALAARGGEG